MPDTEPLAAADPVDLLEVHDLPHPDVDDVCDGAADDSDHQEG